MLIFLAHSAHFEHDGFAFGKVCLADGVDVLIQRELCARSLWVVSDRQHFPGPWFERRQAGDLSHRSRSKRAERQECDECSLDHCASLPPPAQNCARKPAVMREADRTFTRAALRRRSTIMFIVPSTAEFSSLAGLHR